MKTNKETATAFVNGQPCKAGNFYTDGNTATSYDTDIATHENGVILIANYYRCRNWNSCGYFHGRTNTTERQKGEIKTACIEKGIRFFEVATIAIFGRKEHLTNYQCLRAEAYDLEKKAQNARKVENCLRYGRQAQRAHATAEAYYNTFCK